MAKYVIHVGPHKTGSSYLQAHFAGLRPQLAARGIAYPAQWHNGDLGHHALFRRLRERDPGLRAEFAALRDPANRLVLISSEDLSDLKPEELAFFRELVGDAAVQIVFYCRRWSELLASGWQELVKHGHLATFPEFFAGCVMNPFASHVLNFAIRLARLAEAFGEDALRLVSYNHLVDRKIDLFRHFARRFLAWDDPPSPAAPGRINPSLGPIESELVRALHALERARTGERGPMLFANYLRAKASLDTAPLVAAMERELRSLTINEEAPGLRLLHGQLYQDYGARLVEPRAGPHLFAPVRRQLPFVGQNYLLAKGMLDHLARVYDQLHGPVAPIAGG
jgi:hypothetical protein